MFNTDDTRKEDNFIEDASSISQPPPQPKIFKSFPSLTAALQALREVWEFDSYALEVSLPAVFAVRGQAAWWAAQPYLPSTDTAAAAGAAAAAGRETSSLTSVRVTIKDVREALRHQYACQLGELLGKETDQDSAMRLSFGCRLSPQLENEAQWLAPPPPKMGRKKRLLNKRRGEDGSRNAYVAPLPLLSSPTMVSKLATMSKQVFIDACPQSALLLSRPPPLATTNDHHGGDSSAAGGGGVFSNRGISPHATAAVTISPYRLSQYIGGRYVKLQRGLPNSPWFEFNGERKGGTSVQEEIAKIVLPGLRADGYTFMSSGREDIDVRMLGNGRPFAVEVKNMRARMPSAETARALEKSSILAHSGVEIRNLGPLGPESMALFKDGEQEKRKSYAAVCWIPRGVTTDDYQKINALGKEGDDVEIEQWTPLRVLHRRPNLCRCRAVHAMAAESLPGLPQGYFLLRLTTAAGTYVKEFVHGDRGRTRPCIKDILECSSAECVYLDVTGVDHDF
jgi:tRNA pseudouridine synthase 10